MLKLRVPVDIYFNKSLSVGSGFKYGLEMKFLRLSLGV